ncbi:hypothetical protein BJ912DRAFT_337678 [Pholiota molesta]|nr:hypothetical protein BJ912DRAFT_337678 [Pholiota molesta]
MAMLEPEEVRESSEISISTPRVFLSPGTPDDEQDFDPYDPIHLNNEHSRSPSPLIVLYARSSHSSHSHTSSSSRKSYASRIPSPDHSIEAAHPEPTKAIRASETAAGQHETAISSPERRGIDPPPYDLVAPDGPTVTLAADRVSLHRQSSHFRTPAQTSTSSRNASPAPSKKSTLSVPSEGSHYSWRERPMSQLATMQDGPAMGQNPRHTPNDFGELQVRPRPMSMHDNTVQNARPIVTQERPNGSSFAQAFIPPTPPTHSRERLVSPPPSNYAKSTPPSISTYSSSQARNGPPPANRHLPKRLVMPAPLNNMSALSNHNGNGLNGLLHRLTG